MGIGFLERSYNNNVRYDFVKWKRFNQTSILKKLNAKCEKCEISARSKNSDPTIHHKNHNSEDTD